MTRHTPDNQVIQTHHYFLSCIFPFRCLTTKLSSDTCLANYTQDTVTGIGPSISVTRVPLLSEPLVRVQETDDHPYYAYARRMGHSTGIGCLGDTTKPPILLLFAVDDRDNQHQWNTKPHQTPSNRTIHCHVIRYLASICVSRGIFDFDRGSNLRRI